MPLMQYSVSNTIDSANRVLQALRNGNGPSFGVWQSLPGSSYSRMLARCEADWVLVDTEHGNIDDAAMYEAVAAIAACKTSPIVRVAANEPWMVGRALDSGAHGILVPRLHTAEDARRFVASANFPPKGHRGFGSPFPMAAFDTSDPRHYLREANDSIVRIVQIETKEALANVREIASVDGIDILFVGPFDLSIAIGHPLVDGMHEELKRAIQIILEAALKAGKKAGIYCVSTDMAKLFAKMGFHFISVVPDVMCFKQALTTAITAVKSNPL